MITLVLVTQFNSILQPLVIVASVFLSLIGVLWGLILTQTPFGIIMVGIGIISLAGVVVNNAIVLLDYVQQLLARGFSVEDALVEAGLTKADVRACSRELGLETWDKPAAACLASRVPHGTEVTVDLLSRIERAESALVSLGAGDLRVRHHGDVARIEVPEAAFERVVADRDRIVSALRSIGYRFITLDLEGFRSGSLNPNGSDA